jgi:hypothetical protein
VLGREAELSATHGGKVYQCPDVAVELLLLRACWLGQVEEEHHCGGDVLSGPYNLLGAGGVRDDGLLDLKGKRPRTSSNVRSIRLGVVSAVH